MSKVKIERRKYPRTESQLPMKISKEGVDVITETRNISCSGLWCRTDKPVPLMSKVCITLLLPIYSGSKVSTEKIKCSGVVVRSEPLVVQQANAARQNIAIFFTEVSKRDKNKIAQYVIQSFKKEIPYILAPSSKLAQDF